MWLPLLKLRLWMATGGQSGWWWRYRYRVRYQVCSTGFPCVSWAPAPAGCLHPEPPCSGVWRGGYLCQYVPLIVLKSWGAISYVDTIVCTTRGLHIKHVCNSQHSDVNYLRVLLNIPHEMQEMAAIKSIQVFFISHTAYTQFIVQQVNTTNLLAACQFVTVSLESYQEQFRTMSLCSRFSVKMSRF